MNFKVVSERTGQPIGFAMSLVRQLAHFWTRIICYIGYLFPLWDHKRQTLADKIMSTVCLPTRPEPPPQCAWRVRVTAVVIAAPRRRSTGSPDAVRLTGYE